VTRRRRKRFIGSIKKWKREFSPHPVRGEYRILCLSSFRSSAMKKTGSRWSDE